MLEGGEKGHLKTSAGLCELRCLPHLKSLPQVHYLKPQVKENRELSIFAKLLVIALGYTFLCSLLSQILWQVPGLFHALPQLSVCPGLGQNSPTATPRGCKVCSVSSESNLWSDKTDYSPAGEGISMGYSLGSAKGIWELSALTYPLPNMNGGNVPPWSSSAWS